MGRPLGTSAQVVREAPLLLVDLETEQGITRQAHVFCYLPVGAQLIARIFEEVVDFIKGDAIEPAALAIKLARRFRLIGTTGLICQALATLDVFRLPSKLASRRNESAATNTTLFALKLICEQSTNEF